jgi:hypothetical protein
MDAVVRRRSSLSKLGTWLIPSLGICLWIGQVSPSLGAVEPAPGCTSDPQNITYGSLTTCTIDPLGDSDTFTFSGVSGERVRIQVTKTAEGQPQFCLYRPDGTQISCPYAFSGASAEIETTLDRSGVFRIVAKEFGDDSTLSYLLSLQRIAPPLPGAPWISNAQILPVEINPIGDNDLVYFNTCGSGRWGIRLTKTEGSQPQFCLYRPDGTNLICPYAFSGTSAYGEIDVTQAAAHGIGIYEFGQDATLKANLSLTCLAGDCRNTCGTPTPIPIAPTNLAAAAVSTSQINLTWTDNSTNEQGFRIERRQGTGTWSQIASTGPNVTSFASTGLAAATTYGYRVVAYNATGSSAYSNTATATTLSGASRPAAPTNLVARAASSTQINLAWQDNASNEQGFRIQRKIGTGRWVQIAVVPANTTGYANGGLRRNTNYRYRVLAFNAGGTSAWVTSKVVKTPR